MRDYSGTYTVKMVPCVASPNGEFSVPPVCSPREPLTFDMDIRFQQVSRGGHEQHVGPKDTPLNHNLLEHENGLQLLPVSSR